MLQNLCLNVQTQWLSFVFLNSSQADGILYNYTVGHCPDFMELRTEYNDSYPLCENSSASKNNGIAHFRTKTQYENPTAKCHIRSVALNMSLIPKQHFCSEQALK